MKRPITLFILPLLATALLAGCGGGGGGAPATGGAPVSGNVPDTPVLLASSSFQDRCQAPRAGIGFPDRQGTLADEQSFLRLWTDETYLWPTEVPPSRPADFSTAQDYFAVLKSPLLTATGRPKDRYHFTSPTTTWDDYEHGIELGYGLAWAANGSWYDLPRTWRLTSVLPGSQAQLAGLQRGDQLLEVDGRDFVQDGSDSTVLALYAALYPAADGEQHRFVLARGAQKFTVQLRAARLDVPPVQNTRVLDTPTGKVGYLTFNSHNTVAESQLIGAFKQLQAARVDDLVLDLRYNGGGLLAVASEVAYMVAGPASTDGKIFMHLLGNGKVRDYEPMPFLARSEGMDGLAPAQALPRLGLRRVTVLTGPGTCSASEAIINGLRGVDVEVNLIGGQTCGKPYGFYPADNCGTTYFTIQFHNVNNKGFGDYADGFAPTCWADDDLSRAQGDPQEGQLAVALRYRASGLCTAPASASAPLRASAAAPKLVPVQPPYSAVSVQRQR
ncbi:MAG: S41 family peptidase [Pseudomonadota bacterium]